MSIQFEDQETPVNTETDSPQAPSEPQPGDSPENPEQEATEDPETTQPPVEAPTTAPEPATPNPKRKTANVERAPENKRRLAITVNFPAEESEYVEAIIEARIKSGLTIDKGHFIRQCVDFAIHMEKLHGRHQAGFSFATPADLPVTYLKGGFFKPKK